MARRRVYTDAGAAAARMNDLHAVAKAFSDFRPASEVFTRVEAVPTIFVQYDHGVRVGGHPTQRIALVHGPSGEGKTYFTLGLARSFLRFGNPVLDVDAERTLESGFVALALGEHARSPLFFGERPTSYEATRLSVRKFCNTVAALRKSGKIAPDACGLVIVDSIRKLVPEDQWTKILKLAREAGDKEKARDRSAQIKAMMNAAWCDELVPLLEQTNCTMVIIARESDDPNADAKAKLYGGGYVTGGGRALYYDASLDIRVERARFVTRELSEKEQSEKKRPDVYGERHRITIKKSKVSGREDKATVCYFHTSNGRLVPEGFDRARDVVDLAMRLGVARKSGSWVRWGNSKATAAQGEHNAVRKLTADRAALDRLDAQVRERFPSRKPTEITDDGEVSE